MDDFGLKLILYTMIALSAVVIIGIWENILEPIIELLINNVTII